jgi:hypothetical protein
MPGCAQYRANSNYFQLIITNKEAVVVSQVKTLRAVRINFQTNSLTNNNVKPKQVILKVREVAHLVALNHPMILEVEQVHTSLELVERAPIIKVANPDTSHRPPNRMITIRILSQIVLQSRRGMLSSKFSFKGLERTRVSYLTRGWRWTVLIWSKNVIEWESHLAANILKTFRTCLNNLRKSKLRLRQKVPRKPQAPVRAHNIKLR